LDGRSKPKDLNTRPREIKYVSRLSPIAPQNRNIWSWFERKNVKTGEITYEYIEPLVAHLRHPLARCGPFGEAFAFDRSYVVPGVPRGRATYLFDAGASSWKDGAGGPSLKYFAEVWKRHGFDWHTIEGWEGTTSEEDFYRTVPIDWKSKTKFHSEFISTAPSKHPFVPSIIRNKVRKDDYVVFKLDIDSKAVETAVVDYMLEWPDLTYLDEFVWEHHVDNYLMASNWKKTQDMSKTISDSYGYFLKLRQQGIRAHSWV